MGTTLERLEPVEAPEDICLDDALLERTLKIGSALVPNLNNGIPPNSYVAGGSRQKSFITEKGLYGWLRIPFGLRNAPATFQRRLINTVFQPQLGKNMEAYVDDMIEKSRQEQH
ncbi:uncharacterized protein LOC130591393 [Beta vulgaris subsp. vulgaris]|uniref:uncharacterized protein LOC130591393 n=1 Tax=Beta vulgaris subsp. vulgaris TaxID=3555 RepID=UPI002549995D|nr:uncharacterized protein LOC130591393 [Beta vulgaris subsp. vulgaris]